MAFLPACAATDVPADEALGVSLGGVEVAIARHATADGDEYFALQDLCSEGCEIECWLHGSRFDLRTGVPTGLPATTPVATFPVEVRDTPDGGYVYVDTATTLNGVVPA
jgi:3-phenylpropionate/trans-cinnamate dioxygenase ferredoxin subunit